MEALTRPGLGALCSRQDEEGDEGEKGSLGLGECSLHVTTALHSNALRIMRGHPKLHYHNLLDMRSLRKEISESWGALAATRSLLAELELDSADVRDIDYLLSPPRSTVHRITPRKMQAWE